MPLLSSIFLSSLLLLATMEESLTILIFSSHSASTLPLQLCTIDSTTVRMAPDLMVIFVASSSRRISKLLSSFIFSLDRSSMYLIRFSFCPSLVLRSSRVFMRVASFCWFCCLSSFSLTISLRALSTISAWMALRLVSWLSLNLSMFSLLAISSLCRFLSFADSSVRVSQELTLISSSSFSQSCFSANFSSSCIRSMVWGATSVDSRSSSRSFTRRYISYSRKLLLNIDLSFSFSNLLSPDLLGKLMAGGIENPSSSSLSLSVRTNELQTSLGVVGPELLGIGGLSLSVYYNFHSLCLIIPSINNLPQLIQMAAIIGKRQNHRPPGLV